MRNIACVGRYETVFPFRAIGLHTVQCNNSKETRESIEQLVREGFGLIFVEEEFYGDLKDLLDEYREEVTPAIVAIPGAVGSKGEALERIREIIKKAIGADIF